MPRTVNQQEDMNQKQQPVPDSNMRAQSHVTSSMYRRLFIGYHSVYRFYTCSSN